MLLIEKREITIYVSDAVKYYCVGYLEHHTMSNQNGRFYSQYNFLKLEHIKNHQALLQLLGTQKFKDVYTDLPKDTELFKQLKRVCISKVKTQAKLPKTELLRDYQNLKGIIQSAKVSISLNIKEIIESYSNLIDLEKEYFPPEIQTLGRLSYLVR